MKPILSFLLFAITLFAGIPQGGLSFDTLGSTRTLADRAGHLTDTYDYSPYGELRKHSGTSDNAFLFTGEQYDPEAGLYYLRARYYSPELSRFLSRDTYEGTLTDPLSQNPYLYARGNPVLYVDPSGHENIMSLSNNIAVMGILAGGTIATQLINTRTKNSSTNAWLIVAMYNAQTWLREEFADAYVHLAGKAKKPSPYGKGKDESEETALNTSPNDP